MKKGISILLVFTLAFSLFNFMAYADTLIDNKAESGYIENNANVNDTLSDFIVRDFDSDYAVAYNDFENISGYGNTSDLFGIQDTGNQHYKKAFSIPAREGTRFKAADYSNCRYTWNDSTYDMLNETLTVGENYIFSYEYWSDPAPASPKPYLGGAFSAAPMHDGFGSDYTNVPPYYTDNNWHLDSFAFTASQNTLKFSLHTHGTYIKSYFDNYLIMKAGEIVINDSSESITFDAVDGDIFMPTDANTYNKKITVALGSEIKFKLNSSNLFVGVGSVTMGEEVLTPDSDGVYSVKITDDIIISAASDDSLVKDTYFIDSNRNVYFADMLSCFNFTDSLDISSKLFKTTRGDDIVSGDEFLSYGDKIDCQIDDTISYTVRYRGDVAEGGDGEWTVSDITATISHILGLEGTQLPTEAFDINESSTVSVSDVIKLRKKILYSEISVKPNVNTTASMNAYIDDILTRTGAGVTRKDLDNGIYNIGDRTRIANVLRKAVNGEEVKILYFGGSITERGGAGQRVSDCNIDGELATFTSTITETGGYVAWIKTWFESNFPDASFTFINRGISSTDSPLAVHRMVEDVLAYDPDLVINEWSCNDRLDLTYKQAAYEQVLKRMYENDIAVLLYGFSTRTGGGSQDLHKEVADHYTAPFVSYKDALYSNSNYKFFTNDGTHPNMVGHALAAATMTNYLQHIYQNIDVIGSTPLEIADYYHPEAHQYEGAYMADLYDIYNGDVEGVRITDMGSFKFNDFLTQYGDYGFRSYYAAVANYSESYEPMVIEIDRCKTLFILNNIYDIASDGAFYIELNGVEIRNSEFNCSKGKKVDQNPEKGYHWATPLIMYDASSPSVELKIYPDITDSSNEYNRVSILSLLLS